jgi:hypothetical protein
MASEALPKPAKPLPRNPQGMSIDLEWEAVPGATGYIVQVRKFPSPFAEGDERLVAGGDTTKTTVMALQPTSTYCFRVVALRDEERSEPSVEATMDTQAADCTPKERKCAVM